MPAAHRHDDLRICGATTTVIGQSTVFVNDKLWSVDGDPNTHGDGALIPGGAPTVFINGKGVIVLGDHANPDALCIPVGPPHCDPIPIGASGDVFAGG